MREVLRRKSPLLAVGLVVAGVCVLWAAPPGQPVVLEGHGAAEVVLGGGTGGAGRGGLIGLAGMQAEDEKVGERVISAMKGKVHNPLWDELTSDSHMREELAEALGAERRGAGGGGLAAVLSGGSTPSTPKAVRAHASPVHLSTLAARQHHAVHREEKQRQEEAPRQHRGGQPPPLVYNAFASGIVDHYSAHAAPAGTPVAHSGISAAAPKPGKSVRFEDGLKKATGFEDTYAKGDAAKASSSRDGRIRRLEEEVKQLLHKRGGAHKGAETVKQKAIDVVERVIHDAHGGPAAAGGHGGRNGQAASPADPKASLSAFMGKLKGKGLADAEVLGLLKKADVLKAIGDEIQGHGEAPVLRAVRGDIRRTEERNRAVDRKESALEKREEKERERERREAEALQNSIDAETDIVYGGGATSKDLAAAAPAAARSVVTAGGGGAGRAPRAAPGAGHEGKGQAARAVEGDKAGGDLTGDRRAVRHPAAVIREDEGGIVHRTGQRARDARDLEFKDDVVRLSPRRQTITGLAAPPSGARPPPSRGEEADTVRALGFTDANQYERHKMEGALQRERGEVARLRRELADDRGGLSPRGSFGRRHGLTSLREGPSFRRGAEEERESELMGRVGQDLAAVEHFMDRGGGGGGGGRRRRVGAGRDWGAGGGRSGRLRGGGGVWSEVRQALREDTRQEGDRQVPVRGKPVNLDII